MTTILARDCISTVVAGRPTAVTFGNFDGIHLGHQRLMSAVTEEQRRLGSDALSVVVSFYPHPGLVLGKAPRLPNITTLRQDLEILSQLGVNALYLVHFTPRFAALSAQEFINQVLLRTLNTQSLVVGPDARCGHNREGTPEYLQREFDRRGLVCRRVEFVESGSVAISSRRIRAAISEGAVSEAQALLGRPFCYASKVVHGDARGKQLGFPTANLHPNAQVVPAHGVYAVRAEFRGAVYPAVVNIGTRPTFQGSGVRIEAHLLDYGAGDFYGERLSLRFVERLRGEQKFDSLEDLRTQIRNDIASARRILSSIP